MAKKKAKKRGGVQVEFQIKRDEFTNLQALVRSEGVQVLTEENFSEWVRDTLVRGYLNDKRRTAIPVKRLAIYWKLNLFRALLLHVEDKSVAAYVREAVYEELVSRGERGLSECPGWRTVHRRGEKKTTKELRAKALGLKPGPGRRPDAHFHPVNVPMDWFLRMQAMFPRQVSSYVMACAQYKLQGETGKLYEASANVADFLAEWGIDYVE